MTREEQWTVVEACIMDRFDEVRAREHEHRADHYADKNEDIRSLQILQLQAHHAKAEGKCPLIWKLRWGGR